MSSPLGAGLTLVPLCPTVGAMDQAENRSGMAVEQGSGEDPVLRVTFLGHSTVLLEIGGLRILTDPMLTDQRWPLRRVAGSLDPAHLDDVAVVLLSHLHLDHFDPRSLRLLGKDVALVVPSGAGRLLDDLGFRSVTELKAGERLVKNG